MSSNNSNGGSKPSPSRDTTDPTSSPPQHRNDDQDWTTPLGIMNTTNSNSTNTKTHETYDYNSYHEETPPHSNWNFSDFLLEDDTHSATHQSSAGVMSSFTGPLKPIGYNPNEDSEFLYRRADKRSVHFRNRTHVKRSRAAAPDKDYPLLRSSEESSMDEVMKMRVEEIRGIDEYLGGHTDEHDVKKDHPQRRVVSLNDIILGKCHDESSGISGQWNDTLSWMVKFVVVVSVLFTFSLIFVVLPLMILKLTFVNNPAMVLLLVFGPSLMTYAAVLVAQVYDQDKHSMF